MATFRVNYSIEIDGKVNNDKISEDALVGPLGDAGVGTYISPGKTKYLT